MVSIGRGWRREVLAWLHLVRVHQRIGQEEYAYLAEHGLTPAQFDVLAHLASEPGLNQQTLAERLLVTKGNVCGLIDRMERDGLVERRPDPSDRRSYRLQLTEAGRRAFEAAAPGLEETIASQMSHLELEDRNALLRLLARLDRRLRSCSRSREGERTA